MLIDLTVFSRCRPFQINILVNIDYHMTRYIKINLNGIQHTQLNRVTSSIYSSPYQPLNLNTTPSHLVPSVFPGLKVVLFEHLLYE